MEAGDVSTTAYVVVVQREADQIVTLLRSGVGLDLPVPGCGDWTMYDLVTHLGGVHRWATAATATTVDGRVPQSHEPQGLANEALADWFTEGAGGLLAALVGEPGRPCWTLWPPHEVGFWARRQAHETSVHRWDLETALGRPTELDRALALDGIDEVVTTLLPRQLHLGRMAAPVEACELLADGRSWVIGAGAPLVRVAASASDLLLLLWGREPLKQPQVSGDAAVWNRLQRGAITP